LELARGVAQPSIAARQQDDARPRISEPLRSGQPDAARTPGDQDAATGER
jgi:hypothetical protein